MSDRTTSRGNRTAARRSVPTAWLNTRPRLAPEDLPTEVDLSPSRVGAVILCAFGVFWIGACWQFITAMPADAPPALLVLWAFPAIGLALIVWGLMQMRTRRRVAFGFEGVRVRGRRLTGREDWTAAYDDFQGVLQRQHTVRAKNSTRTYQIIQLVHADPGRDLPLHVQRGDTPPRERWEAWARHLGLPALQPDDDGLAARGAGQLDASLGERARGADAATRAVGPPPDGLAVARRGEDDAETLRIDFRRNRLPTVGYLVVFAIPLGFLVAGLAIDAPNAWLAVAVGAAGLVAAGWVRLKDTRSPRALVVTRASVRNDDPWPWGGSDVSELAAEEIEAVRVRKSRANRGLELVVESDRGSLHVGHGLRRGELIWLRDFLTWALATA